MFCCDVGTTDAESFSSQKQSFLLQKFVFLFYFFNLRPVTYKANFLHFMKLLIPSLFLGFSVLLPVGMKAQVSVTRTATDVSISNAYLERHFNISGQHLRPGKMVNKRTAPTATFTPSAGSEEFSLNPVTQKKQVGGLLNRASWTITADGFTPENGCGTPASIIDDNDATYWHSNYTDASLAEMPHWFLVDLGSSQTFRSFGYTTRQADKSVNGHAKEIEIQAGETPTSLTTVYSGTMPYSLNEIWTNFSHNITARYVKVIIKSSWNGAKFAACGEFRLSSEAQAAATEMTKLPRTGWTATADSWCRESATVGEPSLAIDGDAATLWHTFYSGQQGQGSAALPHSLTIDLGAAATFRSFGYLPRSGSEGVRSNGNIAGYEFSVSDNGSDWQTVKTGTLAYTEVATVWTDLGRDITARYVRLTETSAVNGREFGCCAEFNLSTDTVAVPLPTAFSASQMTLDNVREESIDGGKRLVFEMKPYQHVNPADGVSATWKVSMVVEMKEKDHFLHKYLLISGADEAARTTPIDYIEMENMSVEGVAANQRWSHPEGSGGVGGMSAYTMSLGQPFYIDGLFFGSEFPQAENEISNGFGHSRYYSGKSLSSIAKDGVFRTWPNVEGAARSVSEVGVIRQDFFSYIETIARPTKVRMQYNSWYDWMMTITEERINTSFKRMERGFTQHGLRPMDSYVVDDGWNNYNVSDTERSGTTSNVSGFWEFNSKFPTGLQGAAQIAHRYGSDFGIWLGPRGGYNFNASWGHFLESHGNGTYNTRSGDAVTGDSVYVSKLRDFFLTCQKDYGVNYWKLDGFSTVEPQPSNNGRYITGGKNGNYYFTEHWERWYDVFRDLYAEASGRGSDLWLNLTCYVNPSPWILQFCNSVWMQNSNDMGRAVVGGRNSELDKQLSYRDDRYYDFYNANGLQFPQSHIFNHDPIYGKTDCMSPNAMSDNEFRAYLYMMATRGTAFWEMLYSYNMMDEGNKWLINAEALTFIDKNYETLRNAVYFGRSPKSGEIYGYSCWRPVTTGQQAEGIVSFRNPSNTSKTFTFTFDKAVGVPETANNLHAGLIMQYSGTPGAATALTWTPAATTYAYGQNMQLTLRPGEILVLRFGAADTTPATFATVRSTEARKVVAQFSEPVRPTTSAFALYDGATLVGQPTAVSLAADYRTVTLTFANALQDNKAYTLKAQNLSDWNNVLSQDVSPVFYYNAGGLVLRIDSTAQLQQAETVATRSDLRAGVQFLALDKSYTAVSEKTIGGRDAFTFSTLVRTTAANTVIAQQAGAWKLELVNGKPVFKVGHTTFAADSVVNDGRNHQITAVREANGMVKVYIDGNLQGTAYNAAYAEEVLTPAPLQLGGTAGLELAAAGLYVGAADYEKAAADASAALTEKYLISVTVPTGLDVTFTPKAGVTAAGEQLVAAVAPGKTVSVKAVAQDGFRLAGYTKDGVQTTLNAGRDSVATVHFAAVRADHNLVFVVKKTTGIAEASANGLKVTTTPASIEVTGASPLSIRAYTSDGRLLGTAKGTDRVVLSTTAWPAGTYILDIMTAGNSKTVKILK